MKETNFKTDTKGKESKKPDIKIFVSHRIDMEAETIDNPLYVNVRCGAVFDKRENIDMLGDDTGDNISEKRESFNELTVQYWAWKNVDADYYGLCHYRRYLSFSDKTYKVESGESNNNCVVEDYLSEKIIVKHCLNEKKMREVIENNDVIVFKPIKAQFNNIQAMKKSPDYHNIEDMYETLKIIKELYPDMSSIAEKYMNNNEIYLYNCFIMRKEIFYKYSEWLFNILFELEKRIDMKYYSINQYRTPGTIAERLLGIYIAYLSKCKQIQKQQLIFFKYIKKQSELQPFKKEQVTIVSNFNDNYAKIFSTFLLSALMNISKDRYYEFVVLSEDIREENKNKLLGIVREYKNVKISFYNPFKMLDDVKLFVDNSVYSKDLYVRVIIPYILEKYDKVLVIDVDTICKTDLKELYDQNVSSYCMAAVRDTVYGGYLNGARCDIVEYCKNTLKLIKPYNYCNTGILICNLNKMRQKYSLKFLINHINTHKYMIYEQDMLNVLYDDDILFLDPKWNVFTYTNSHIENSVLYAPKKDYENYLKARKQPYIIHYAAHPKPWWVSSADFGADYWNIARISPFYEELLATVSWHLSNHLVAQSNHLVAQSNTNIKIGRFRRIVDIILPHGSKRRKIVKKLLFR